MTRFAVVLALGAVLASIGMSPAQNASPYIGQEGRSIKALSEPEVRDLLEGRGMGLAKAAELNGYPGPAHVRALGKQLRLSDDQLAQITTIFDHMNGTAKSLGAEMIDREQALDQLFVKGEITPERLATETIAIGELNGRLRAVHLAAHLETRALLQPDQLALYRQLRGYGESKGHHRH